MGCVCFFCFSNSSTGIGFLWGMECHAHGGKLGSGNKKAERERERRGKSSWPKAHLPARANLATLPSLTLCWPFINLVPLLPHIYLHCPSLAGPAHIFSHFFSFSSSIANEIEGKYPNSKSRTINVIKCFSTSMVNHSPENEP